MPNPLVMVVDDEKNVADLIAQTIRETGRYDVITAYSGHEALLNLSKNKILFGLRGNKIRFVLLDIKMPQFDGLQTLEEIRRDYSDSIGISMLTAWEDAEKWDRATSGFVVNYIRKPFKSDDVIGTLDKYFAGHETKMVLDTFDKHIQKREEFKKKPSE